MTFRCISSIWLTRLPKQDLAKYAEVHAKAANVAAVKEKDEPFGRGVWVGFTYKPRNKIMEDEMLAARAAEDEEVMQVMF